MGQRLLIRAHPCLSVVEFLGLRLAALGLCAFALNSGAKNQAPSHRVAVSRSDVGEAFHLAALLKGNRAGKSNLIAPNPTKSHHF
jgi:hypothetical protein